MRFADAAARLRALPDPLPEPPTLLTPQPGNTGRRVSGAGDNASTPSAVPPSGPRPTAPQAADDAGLSEDAYRPSAVLVLVFPDDAGEARVLLTARPERDIRHAGQVSFPGGATDPGDADPVATALREAREEVGLDAAAGEVEVVGELDPVTIPVSGFRLVPVLALARRHPDLSPDPREVRAVFDAPVDRFLPGAPLGRFEREVAPGLRIRYAAFDFEGHHIWGATARILGQLGAVLAPAVLAPADPYQGSPLAGS
jgi:8-oxo-dGTP pyrophosphatase MutT (NUDIX family)